MIIAMFRTQLKPQANLEALGALHQKMHAIVSNMPGFVSVKLFTAEDGEALALAEFESLDSLKVGKSIQNTSWLNKGGAKNSLQRIMFRSAA